MTAVSTQRRLAAQRAAALSDQALLAECEEEFFVAGGPGGQHRNKTASGVRLTHHLSEMSVTATERRSQSQNRDTALERLRAGLSRLAAVPKPRHKTKPTRHAREKRLQSKKRLSAKKKLRHSVL
jgi:protein subunit release factor B